MNLLYTNAAFMHSSVYWMSENCVDAVECVPFPEKLLSLSMARFQLTTTNEGVSFYPPNEEKKQKNKKELLSENK